MFADQHISEEDVSEVVVTEEVVESTGDKDSAQRFSSAYIRVSYHDSVSQV